MDLHIKLKGMKSLLSMKILKSLQTYAVCVEKDDVFMVNERKHLFHIVDPSPWPIITALGAFLLTSGLAFFMHRIQLGGYVLLCGFFILILSSIFWFGEIIDEGTFRGSHTNIVRNGLRWGFLFFILSEVMLFFGFFWGFAHASLNVAGEIGLIWPPMYIEPISFLDYPLLNTGLLITSGFSVTWAHKSLAAGLVSEAIDGLVVTLIIGSIFVLFQAFEYYESSFNISDNVYSSTFFMLTGLHGMHVIVGVTFLFISLFRLLLNHYLINHYLGFVLAIWYWHFVDIIWIILFLIVYVWGTL